MHTTLIIARHGNTFAPGDTPTRVGARTDLPLVASGELQGKKLGLYLRHVDIRPHVVFASRLKRSYDMARIALQTLGHDVPIRVEGQFDEIDYGPDENKTDDEVIARIGAQALADWNERAKVPAGWQVQPDVIIHNWLAFGERCRHDFAGQTILVVTSNGIARFAPYLTGDFAAFTRQYDIKIATGALCHLRERGGQWVIEQWNLKPAEWLSTHR